MEYLGPGAENIGPQAAASILVERLKNSGHLGDRRDALEALLNLSKKHPREVGQAGGMPIFTDILRAGVADGAMVQTIVEIMLKLFVRRDDVDEEGEGEQGGESNAAATAGANIAGFLDDEQNVQTLLDLLESPDTLTALSAIQVLQAVQKSAADSLEASILECPAGMQALVEVLRDPREEIRNEIILLLGQLTSTNLEVKKFVAFQEGFERLFDIMDQEGMLESGSVIVKDCLDVCLNVLAGPSLTRALFCQSKCLSCVHQLIDVRTASGAHTELAAKGGEDGRGDAPPSRAGGQDGETSSSCTMSAIQSEIACKALDLLLIILQPEGSDPNAQSLSAAFSSTGGGSESAVDPKRAERQAAVSGAAEGTLSEMVAHVGFSRADDFSGSTMACRERAMRVTGAMVDGHATNQYQMGELLVQDVGSASVTLATLVMEGALGEGGADPALNDLFHWVLGCFFHENKLGCAQVVSHVIAPPPPPMELDLDVEAWVPPTPPGKVLLDSLAASAEALFAETARVEVGGKRDGGKQGSVEAAAHAAAAISRGCVILSMLFRHGGGATKEIALRVPVDLPPPSHRTTLLHALLRWVELATSHTSTAADPDEILATANSKGPGLAAAIGVGSLGPISEADNAEEIALARASAVADAATSLLKLLCGWLHDCPAAVRELLENPANLFIVDVAAGRCSLLQLTEFGGGPNGGTPALGAPAGGSEVTAAARGGVKAESIAGRDVGGFKSQIAAVKGLTCLTLGILLEYVEGTPRGRSASGAGGGGGGGAGMGYREHAWNRELVMKMIQNRVGITPFMASIEATKRAFAEAEADQRRRARAARGGRERSGSGVGGAERVQGTGDGALRLDTRFAPLLDQAAEEARRRVISLFTHGGGSSEGGDGKASLSGAAGIAPGEGGDSVGGTGLACVVEMQESEIATLKQELSEALSRVPRGRGEGGGVSALEAALKKQVDELMGLQEERSKEIDSLGVQLRDALGRLDEERESVQQLSSELEGLSVTVSSLERQLMDREADAEGLRRQIAAGGDQSLREAELTRQLDEARSRASQAEDELERVQRQSMAEAEAQEDLKEALAESEVKWSKAVGDLQVALEEMRAQNGQDTSSPSHAKNDGGIREVGGDAELSRVVEDLEKTKAALLQKEAVVGQLERALAQRAEEAEATQNEMASIREGTESVRASLREERETAAAQHRRLSSEVDRLESEAEELRQQLDNTVRRLAKASSGGNQQIEALQKELSAVREREEREAIEWRRRLKEARDLSEEEASRHENLLQQTEKKLNDHWTLQMERKEAELLKLAEESRLLKLAAESTSRRLGQMAEEAERLGKRAELVDVFEARCSRLEEAAATAAQDVERRLRGEMKREREAAKAARESTAEVESRLQETKAELSAKAVAERDLRERLDQVHAYLSQSEEDRDAAQERERIALAKLSATEEAMGSLQKRMEQAARQAAAELEDRDGVIAAVEDARVAQEEETERLRNRLKALNRGPSQAVPELTDGKKQTNGTVSSSSALELGHDSGRESMKALNGGSRDVMVEGEEYLDLLSEHEDLLQLLAQQEVVRKKLFTALKESGGHRLAKAVMEDAETLVVNTYGRFVRYTIEDEEEAQTEYEQPQYHQNGGGSESGAGSARDTVEGRAPPPSRGRVAV